MANLEHAEDDKEGVKMSVEVTTTGTQVIKQELHARDVGVLPCAIPSFTDACKLLSAPYSCLVTHTHRKHVALPPMYLNKKRSGIEGELASELLKFSPSFSGVPLAYENIRIVGQHGDIYDDSGYIHMDIEANFILFQPQKGHKLLGRVNKVGEGHVGCLVHSCFNASINKPRPVSMEGWLEFGPKIGDELEFEVISLDADTAGVLLIKGRLLSTRAQELMSLSEGLESGVPVNQTEPEPESESETDPEDVKPTPDTCNDSTDDTPKKKKKKKKRVKSEEVEVVVTSIQENNNTILELEICDTNGNDLGEKKKKKKKKKEKEVKEEPDEDFLGNSSGYHSDKSSKKRKYEADVSVDANEIDHPPKSKKKKRKSDVN